MEWWSAGCSIKYLLHTAVFCAAVLSHPPMKFSSHTGSPSSSPTKVQGFAASASSIPRCSAHKDRRSEWAKLDACTNVLNESQTRWVVAHPVWLAIHHDIDVTFTLIGQNPVAHLQNVSHAFYVELAAPSTSESRSPAWDLSLQPAKRVIVSGLVELNKRLLDVSWSTYADAIIHNH